VVTVEQFLKWKVLPRFMMLASTMMSWRCAEWFMDLDNPTAAQSAFVSVVMGVMTGVFGIWMGHEHKGEIMLAALIGPIANLASSWMSSKVEKVKADGQAQVAQARAKAVVAEKVATGEVAWEKSMADSTDNSWKDEFALIVLLLPAILVFIPSMTEYVRVGFEVLNTLPEWYQYLLFIAISASFGIKGAGAAMKMLGKK
jgi:hypothetical protein